jgi:hypothetical protein
MFSTKGHVMITLKDWTQCVNYRITEGSDYQWHCYGSSAYTLDSWDGDQDGVSSSLVFDTNTQIVYQVEVHDYADQRSYRYINPHYRDAYLKECKQRGLEDEAYDGVRFVDLEVAEDFLAKCRAIMNYEHYDHRVSVPVEFTDDELLKYMKLAHERDMTFNQFVEEALNAAIEEFKRDPEGMKIRAQTFIKQESEPRGY